MDCGKSNLINQALKIFREVYTDFLRELFHKKFGPHWLSKVQPLLKTSREKKKHPNAYFDIPNILSLILGNWDGFLENYITRQERGYLFEVRNMRNRWAHQENISSNDLLRTFDNILRLMHLHYFSNLEIDSTTSVQEFDESKIEQVKKLKHYVFLKMAENIERQYGIERKRVRPDRNMKLQHIIFGKRDRNRRENKLSIPEMNGRRNNYAPNRPFMNNRNPPVVNNRNLPPPQYNQGYNPNFPANNIRNSNVPNFNNNNNNNGGYGFNNNNNNFQMYQNNNNGGTFQEEEEDISMMERKNGYY